MILIIKCVALSSKEILVETILDVFFFLCSFLVLHCNKRKQVLLKIKSSIMSKYQTQPVAACRGIETRKIHNNAARERSRVRTLRAAFLQLQRTLPVREHIRTHTHTHTHCLSPSLPFLLSLSLSHTHTHTHSLPRKRRKSRVGA